MSDVICVCGMTKAAHALTGNGVPEAYLCRGYRPCLDWPDSEGWWWEHDTKHDDCMDEIVFAEEVDGEILICDGEGYLDRAQAWYSMCAPKFTRAEASPFEKGTTDSN